MIIKSSLIYDFVWWRLLETREMQGNEATSIRCSAPKRIRFIKVNIRCLIEQVAKRIWMISEKMIKKQIKNRIKQFVELIRLHRPSDIPYRMTLQYLLPLRFCQVSRIKRLNYNDKLKKPAKLNMSILSFANWITCFEHAKNPMKKEN